MFKWIGLRSVGELLVITLGVIPLVMSALGGMFEAPDPMKVYLEVLFGYGLWLPAWALYIRHTEKIKEKVL